MRDRESRPVTAVERKIGPVGSFSDFRGAAEGWSPDPAYKERALQLEFTVEDESVYTMSWSATTYRRVARNGLCR
jgi:hypothetical protein